MEKIRMTFYLNFIVIVSVIFSLILTLLMGIFLRFFISGSEGIFLLKAFIVMVVLQIPAAIYLFLNLSKRRDLFIINRDIVQENKTIIKKKDIISIERKNIFKVSIKYKTENESNEIFVTITNKKIRYIKELLGVTNKKELKDSYINEF